MNNHTISPILSRHGGLRKPPGHLRLALAVFVLASLAAIALVVAMLWPRWPGGIAPDAPALPITIDKVTFNIPPAAIRAAVQRRVGVQERVDLSFLWPSLIPPDPTSKPTPGDSGPALDRIFVTLASSAGTLAPAERLTNIYPRYTEPLVSEGPGGLRSLRFRDDSPYRGEDLLFPADEPERFILRCTRDGTAHLSGTCLVERRVDTVAVTVRFPTDWLAGWREVDAAVDRVITRLRASEK